ncbi:ribonuclease H-like domain-containing protein [Tanacetum coccineum]
MAIGDASGSNVVDSINSLDAGNPLHVQNSDNTSSVLIPFKLQGTENYRIWNGAMKLALQARNKFGFVDGTCLKSAYDTSNVLSAQWDRCNAMVLTWIMNSVSHDVYMGLVYSDNCASVWKELQETYDKVDGSVVYNLLQKNNTVKQGGSSVADYYHRLNSLWREFDALTKIPKCVCEVQCACDASKELSLHQQIMKLMQFLMGLDDCYQPVRSALLTRDALSDVKDAYNIVSKEESHRGIPESFGTSDAKLNATSFGKSGHTIDRCYGIVGFPANFKRASNNNGKQSFNENVDVKCDKQNLGSPSTSGFTPEQMKKLLNLINDNGASNFHANMAGKYSFFNGNVWFNMNFSKFFCANNKLYVKTISLGWIIDSGANQHLTVSTVGMINDVDVTSLSITVGHPNGTLATISHIGNLKLTDNVILYDVLVVPGYCVSLLSVNKLIRDSKMFVGFDEEKCYIHDLTRQKILGTGSELGHPADQVLAILHNDLKISKSSSVPVCEVCHRAKQTREPFPLSDHKSKNLGDLVHLDL